MTGLPDPAARGLPLCLGLHITKCAGTSLMTTVRRALSEDEYYFFSSYHENWLASRPLFAALRSPERLRIVFGHYCHETLLSVFAHRPIFLFTGLRDPLERAVSGFRQANAVRAQAGRPPIDAAGYLASQRNPICAEVLRCFPSLASGPAPPWRKAQAALSLFDLVTDTAHFDVHGRAVLAVIDGPARDIVRDNISGERPLPAATNAFVRAECERLRADAEPHLGEDMRLYRAIQPWLGRADLRADIAGAPWAIDRAAFVAGLPQPDQARAAFCAFEQDFMLAEFDELGKLAELRGWLEARAAEAEAMARRIVLPA
jgi:hypothetical protein